MKAVNPLTVETDNDLEIVIIREFDAPRELLFRCHTEAELVRQWLLGPPGWTMPVCEVDARVGGKYRYVWRKDSGTEMGMGGEFRELVRPERIVNTQLFDQDWTGGETRGTMTFTENNGRTRMHQLILYSSKEARDGALQTGMTAGMQAGYQRLDELMETLK
ncbi:MAG: SRPBCC family protein [Gemmatimonadaceae bacterium]